MNKPVLSIDVSKLNSYAAAFLSYGKPYKKPFPFKHTPEDTNLLLGWLADLEEKTGQKPEVVLEATGHFSKPIKSFFLDAGYQVIELNPLQTHERKKSSIRKVKTDPVDTNRIAQVYYLNTFVPQSKFPVYITELRSLSRQYGGLTTLSAEAQVRFRGIVDLVFPQFDSVFTNACCMTALHFISAFPTPESVLSANRGELASVLKISKRSDSWIETKLDKIITAARESLPYKEAQQSNVRVLQDYVKILVTLETILTDMRAQIIEWAKLSPVFPLLVSIPGVGELTAAIILGEIGDISRFPTVKQLIAYAGLDPSVFQSGKYKATNNKISKRGSTYLRRALYLAATAGIRRPKGNPTNPLLYDYYNHKLSEGKPVRVAIVATSSKLLRIIYGIWTSQQPFRC